MTAAKTIEQEIMAIAQAHFDAEERNDIEAAVDLCADDMTWEAPARGLHYQGKKAVAANYRFMFARMADLRVRKVLDFFAAGSHVVHDAIVVFTLTGENLWSFPVGSRIEMRLLHVFEIRDGKILVEKAFEIPRLAP